MTLTYQLDLDRVKMNHHAKYLGQTSFLYRANTHTVDRLGYQATVVSKNNKAKTTISSGVYSGQGKRLPVHFF